MAAWHRQQAAHAVVTCSLLCRSPDIPYMPRPQSRPLTEQWLSRDWAVITVWLSSSVSTIKGESRKTMPPKSLKCSHTSTTWTRKLKLSQIVPPCRTTICESYSFLVHVVEVWEHFKDFGGLVFPWFFLYPVLYCTSLQIYISIVSGWLATHKGWHPNN